MRYFGNRRPRGFHYTYRFSSERRDLLDSLRRGVAPGELAARSLEADGANAREPRRRAAFVLPLWIAAAGLLLLLAAVLLSAL